MRKIINFKIINYKFFTYRSIFISKMSTTHDCFISYESNETSEVYLPTCNFGMIRTTRKHALSKARAVRKGWQNVSAYPRRGIPWERSSFTWTEPLRCDERGRISHIDCLLMSYSWDCFTLLRNFYKKIES